MKATKWTPTESLIANSSKEEPVDTLFGSLSLLRVKQPAEDYAVLPLRGLWGVHAPLNSHDPPAARMCVQDQYQQRSERPPTQTRWLFRPYADYSWSWD
ncbi:hypothetical protein J6590_002680 [Homalodisca vitripennis]|nr:hypothetical protein J6590_002680 [Homalodisca vitripennis]